MSKACVSLLIGTTADFNPSNAGGGGERVLWTAVRAAQRRWPKAVCAIYTGDHDVDKATIIEKIEVCIPLPFL